MSTDPHQPTPPRPPVAAYREVVGLLLLIVGAATLLTAAYRASTDLGLALTGLLGASVGLWLSIGEAP